MVGSREYALGPAPSHAGGRSAAVGGELRAVVLAAIGAVGCGRLPVAAHVRHSGARELHLLRHSAHVAGRGNGAGLPPAHHALRVLRVLERDHRLLRHGAHQRLLLSYGGRRVRPGLSQSERLSGDEPDLRHRDGGRDPALRGRHPARDTASATHAGAPEDACLGFLHRDMGSAEEPLLPCRVPGAAVRLVGAGCGVGGGALHGRSLLGLTDGAAVLSGACGFLRVSGGVRANAGGHAVAGQAPHRDARAGGGDRGPERAHLPAAVGSVLVS